MYLLAIEVSTNILLANSIVAMSIERFGGGGRRLGSNSHLNKMVILGDDLNRSIRKVNKALCHPVSLCVHFKIKCITFSENIKLALEGSNHPS